MISFDQIKVHLDASSLICYFDSVKIHTNVSGDYFRKVGLIRLISQFVINLPN